MPIIHRPDGVCDRLGELFIVPLDRLLHMHLLEGVLFVCELFQDLFDRWDGACFGVGGGEEGATGDDVRGEVEIHFEVFDVLVLDDQFPVPVRVCLVCLALFDVVAYL